MIEKMHERTNGPVFKIIFALVSLSFVITGIGTGLAGVDTSAAKVNGTAIEQQAFNAAKSRQQNILNTQMGERFWDLLDTPEYAAQFNQFILNGLIDDELLRQYAQNLKLGISAEQIKSEIVHSPTFQQDGKFNNQLYQQALRNNGLSADGYAAIVNEEMLFSQIQEGIVGSHFSVPAEQELLAKLLLQKRQVRLANYSVAAEAQNQTASGEELQAYYDAHKNAFVEPEKLAIEYVTLTPENVAKNVQVTDEQIATYYEKNKADYVTQGETHIAHIQVANEADAKALEQQLAGGADFSALAKAKSTDKLSAAQGGDLGWAKVGTFPKAFEDAANGLQVGAVSQAVNVDGAYHIIKVLARKNEQAIPLEQVKDNIAKTIRNELLLTEYSNLAREMANKAFENNGSLESVAQAGGVAIQKTAQFTQQNVPAELNNEKVLKALFSGELRQSGQNSDALDIGDEHNPKTMFVRVSDYQADRVKTLDEAKADVEVAVKQQKAEQALIAKAQEIIKLLESGQAADVQFGAAQTLVYAQAQGQQPVLAQTVFSMTKPTDKATYSVARDEQGNVVIVALDKVMDGSSEEFKPLAAQFNQADQLLLRNDLLKDLRAKASIEVNEDFMEQLGSSSH
ncbi:peptidyl-prolyl cis-trans isomerase D [Actinobacillus ureae]|uniref:SurA N-terminal domain-containing protein n=1 Tax=Actinobacillus ureae TaxID=723 RepID=UPI000E135830|nr:SurA N-terminal domain-containing protein [Actinobacillus ureae]SUT85841.1 peptidyl-prolyl cis-trans isomerase D [Actinobacillus ureae]SUU43935.1 peptidyl-prolyl cis-trans isomerase D [Actinobacillus ureae]